VHQQHAAIYWCWYWLVCGHLTIADNPAHPPACLPAHPPICSALPSWPCFACCQVQTWTIWWDPVNTTAAESGAVVGIQGECSGPDKPTLQVGHGRQSVPAVRLIAGACMMSACVPPGFLIGGACISCHLCACACRATGLDLVLCDNHLLVCFHLDFVAQCAAAVAPGAALIALQCNPFVLRLFSTLLRMLSRPCSPIRLQVLPAVGPSSSLAISNEGFSTTDGLSGVLIDKCEPGCWAGCQDKRGRGSGYMSL